MSHKHVLLIIMTIQIGMVNLKGLAFVSMSSKVTQRENKVRVELKDIRGRSTSDSLSNLEVAVESDQIQSVQSGGITQILYFANKGDRQIEILNPLDSIQVLVINKEGWPINLPSLPSKNRINKRGDEHIWQDGPFEVVKAISQGQEKIGADIYERTIRIPSGDHYKVIVKIARILPSSRKPEASPSTGQPPATVKAIKIPAGDYQVKFTIPVISTSGDNGSRLLQSDLIKVSLLDR